METKSACCPASPGLMEPLYEKYSGLLFTAAEIDELNHVVKEIGETPWNLADLKSVQV